MTDEDDVKELEKKYKASLETKLKAFDEWQKKQDEVLKAEQEKIEKEEADKKLKAEKEAESKQFEQFKSMLEKNYDIKPKQSTNLPEGVSKEQFNALVKAGAINPDYVAGVPKGVDIESFNKTKAFFMDKGVIPKDWTPGQSTEQSQFGSNDELHKKLEVSLGKEFTKLKATRGLEFDSKIIPYGYDDYFNAMTEKQWQGIKATNSDSGCDDNYAAWTPADYYANAVWYALTCKGHLAGKVTVRGLDVSEGEGGIIQIRVAGSRSAQGPMAACECYSCASQTWNTYSTTVDVYGDDSVICDQDVFTAGQIIVTATLKTMSDALAVQLDTEIWNQLNTATPGYTETSTTSFICDPSVGSYGACCMYAANLYKEILDLRARMVAANYDPDFIILHPRIANYLKYKEGVTPPPWMHGEVKVKDGTLISVAGINVIEYCGASTCSDNEAGTSFRAAIMIDSSRAVSEAWGKKPTFEKDRNPRCRSTEYVVSMYVGIDELDTGAIGHINNP